MSEEVVQDCLRSYLKNNGFTHHEKLIKESSSTYPEVQDFFKNLSGSERFHYFRNNSDTFTIDNDGYVTFVIDVEYEVIQHLKELLQKNGWIPYLELINTLTNSATCLKYYFDGFSRQEKYYFFKSNRSDFVIIKKYVFLSLENRRYNVDYDDEVTVYENTLDDLEPEVEERVLRSLAMILIENNVGIHYSSLLDLLTHDDVFNNNFSSEYERCLFFAKHPSWFRITLDKCVYLNPRKKNEIEREEPAVINFLVATLRNLGWLHCTTLKYSLPKSSSGAKNFFDSFDESDVYWFFKDRPSHFNIANNGYVYLPAKTENEMINHLKTKWMSPLLHFPNATRPIKIFEHDSVTAFLVRKLRAKTLKIMYFKNLINELSSSSLDIKDYFKGLTDYHLCLFFKNHENFDIDIHRNVTLSEKMKSLGFSATSSLQLDMPVNVQCLAFQEDTKTVAMGQTSSVHSNSDSLEEEIIIYFLSALRESSIHYQTLVKSLQTSIPNAKEYYLNFTSSEWFLFFKNNDHFTIDDNNGYVSRSFTSKKNSLSYKTKNSTEKASTIGCTESDAPAGREDAFKFVFETLSEFGSMHYSHLPKFALESSVEIFEGFSKMDWLKFCKNQEKHFVVSIDGNVSLADPSGPVTSISSNNRDKEVIDYMTDELLKSSGSSKVSKEPTEEKATVSEQNDHCVQILHLQDEETEDDDESLSSTDSSGSFATAPSSYGEEEMPPALLDECIKDSSSENLVSLPCNKFSNEISGQENNCDKIDQGENSIGGMNLCENQTVALDSSNRKLSNGTTNSPEGKVARTLEEQDIVNESFSLLPSTPEEQSTVHDFCLKLLRNTGSMHYSHIIEKMEISNSRTISKLNREKKLAFFMSQPAYKVSKDGFVSYSGQENAVSQEEIEVLNHLVTMLENIGWVFLKWLTDPQVRNSNPVSDYFSDFTHSEKQFFFYLRPYYFKIIGFYICLSDNISKVKVFDVKQDKTHSVIDAFCHILDNAGPMHFCTLIGQLRNFVDPNLAEYFQGLNFYLKRHFFRKHWNFFQIEQDGYVYRIRTNARYSKVESNVNFKSLRKIQDKVLNLIKNILFNSDDPVLYIDLIESVSFASLDVKNFFRDFSLPEKFYYFKRRPASFSVIDFRFIQLSSFIQVEEEMFCKTVREGIKVSETTSLFHTQREVRDVGKIPQETVSESHDSTTFRINTSNDTFESNKYKKINFIGKDSESIQQTSYVDTRSVPKFVEHNTQYSDSTDDHMKDETDLSVQEQTNNHQQKEKGSELQLMSNRLGRPSTSISKKSEELNSEPCDSNSCGNSNSLQQIILQSNSLVLTLQNLTTFFDNTFKDFVACDKVEKRKVMVSDISESLRNIKTIYENLKLLDLVEIGDCEMVLADCAVIQQRNVVDVEKEVAEFLVEFLTDVNSHPHYETLFIHLKQSQLLRKTSIFSLFFCINNQQFKQFLRRNSVFCVDSDGMVTLRQNKRMNEGH